MSQVQKLRALMFSREGQWVPLPDVQALGIAQHGARFKELREELAPRGYRIENKMEHGTDGIVRSWYKLTHSAPAPPAKPEPAPEWNDRPRSTGLPLFDLAMRP